MTERQSKKSMPKIHDDAVDGSHSAAEIMVDAHPFADVKSVRNPGTAPAICLAGYEEDPAESHIIRGID